MSGPSFGGASLAEFALLAALLVLVGGGIVVRMALLDAALSGGDPAAGETRVNCPACGARTTVGTGVCEYCADPLPDGPSADGDEE